MFERFTERARRVVVLAQENARDCDHTRIEPEHLLIALLQEGEGVAWQALTSVCPVPSAIAALAQENLMRVPTSSVPLPHIPFDWATKKVLELSMREGLQLGHNYIGTEHILLAIIRYGGTAAELLQAEGVDLQKLRKEVIRLNMEHSPQPKRPASKTTQEISDTLADAMEQIATANKQLMLAAHTISGLADKLR